MHPHLIAGNNKSEYGQIFAVVGEKSERSCEACVMFVS